MAEYLTDDLTYRDPLFFGSSDALYADESEIAGALRDTPSSFEDL
jgi:hypothetical protein